MKLSKEPDMLIVVELPDTESDFNFFIGLVWGLFLLCLFWMAIIVVILIWI